MGPAWTLSLVIGLVAVGSSFYLLVRSASARKASPVEHVSTDRGPLTKLPTASVVAEEVPVVSAVAVAPASVQATADTPTPTVSEPVDPEADLPAPDASDTLAAPHEADDAAALAEAEQDVAALPFPSDSLADRGERRAALLRARRLRVRAKLPSRVEATPPPPVPQPIPEAVKLADRPMGIVVAHATTYQAGLPPVHQEIRLGLSVRQMPR